MKGWQGRFKGRGNVEIYWQSWLPTKPRATVVVVHGLGEHSGRYEHVAEALVAAGCAVYALDHRGHGHSGGHRALIDRFSHAVEDIDQLLELARREQPRRPLFLLGHSMGGALSLSYALRNPGKLYGLILSGPAVALDGAPPLMGPISRILSAVLPRLGMFSVDPSLVSRDPAAVERYSRDPFNLRGKVPARTLGEIVRFVQSLPAALPALQLPLLVLHGRDDKLAGVSGSEMVMAKVSAKDKTLNVYEGLYHEIFNELPEDRERVIRDLVDWIVERVERRPTGLTAAA